MSSQSVEVKLAGRFQNGSYSLVSRYHSPNETVAYYYVDCPALREAQSKSNSSSAGDAWLFNSKPAAERAAEEERKSAGSGARY